MKEILVDCRKCGSNACAEITNSENEASYKAWICMTCGFTSSPGTDDSNKELIESGLPEIYKDLRFKDSIGLYWYPTSINLPKNGMVFVDGTSTKDWKWSAVPARKLKLKEKIKYPEYITHIPDMKKKKLFEQLEFMDALGSIGYFDLVKNENPS